MEPRLYLPRWVLPHFWYFCPALNLKSFPYNGTASAGKVAFAISGCLGCLEHPPDRLLVWLWTFRRTPDPGLSFLDCCSNEQAVTHGVHAWSHAVCQNARFVKTCSTADHYTQSMFNAWQWQVYSARPDHAWGTRAVYLIPSGRVVFHCPHQDFPAGSITSLTEFSVPASYWERTC